MASTLEKGPSKSAGTLQVSYLVCSGWWLVRAASLGNGNGTPAPFPLRGNKRGRERKCLGSSLFRGKQEGSSNSVEQTQKLAGQLGHPKVEPASLNGRSQVDWRILSSVIPFSSPAFCSYTAPRLSDLEIFCVQSLSVYTSW